MRKYSLWTVLLLLVLLASGCSKPAAQAESTAPQSAEAAADTESTDTESAGTEAVPLQEQAEPVYIAEGIRKLTVTKDGEAVLEIAYQPREYESTYQYWKIPVPYGDQAVLDTEALLALFHKLEELELKSGDTAAADTGLDSSNTSITFEYCQADPDDEKSSYQPEADSTATLLIGNKDGSGSYYTALQAQPEQVIMLPEAVIDELLNTDPFTLIIKVSTVIDAATVSEVEIGTAEQSDTMKEQDGSFYLGDQEVAEEQYRDLYTQLLSVLIEKELEQDQTKTGELLLSLRFKRSVEQAPEILVQYHAVDEQYASVTVNGAAHFLVDRAAVQELTETIKKAYEG